MIKHPAGKMSLGTGTEGSAGRSRRSESGGGSARVLRFPIDRPPVRPAHSGSPVREAILPETEPSPRDRFLSALAMEHRGFVDGAVAHLRSLHREVARDCDPSLAIGIRYVLASLLMLRGEDQEARDLTEDGLLLAWENGAGEELELLDNLSRQLEE